MQAAAQRPWQLASTRSPTGSRRRGLDDRRAVGEERGALGDDAVAGAETVEDLDLPAAGEPRLHGTPARHEPSLSHRYEDRRVALADDDRPFGHHERPRVRSQR